MAARIEHTDLERKRERQRERDRERERPALVLLDRKNPCPRENVLRTGCPLGCEIVVDVASVGI